MHDVALLTFLYSYRRSNFISETFTFDVDFGTTFEKVPCRPSAKSQYHYSPLLPFLED